jgi:hypothetical protein
LYGNRVYGQIQLDLYVAQLKLFGDQHHRASNGLIHIQQLETRGSRSPKCSYARDDCSSTLDLRQGGFQSRYDHFRRFPTLNGVKRITHKETDIIERIVHFVRNTGGQFSDAR